MIFHSYVKLPEGKYPIIKHPLASYKMLGTIMYHPRESDTFWQFLTHFFAPFVGAEVLDRGQQPRHATLGSSASGSPGNEIATVDISLHGGIIGIKHGNIFMGCNGNLNNHKMGITIILMEYPMFIVHIKLSIWWYNCPYG